MIEAVVPTKAIIIKVVTKIAIVILSEITGAFFAL